MGGSTCIHCEHPCHCDMMCSVFFKNRGEHSVQCKCDDCNCRPNWGDETIGME
jgi:hypothetical protein